MKKLFFSLTQKEDVSGGQKVFLFGETFQTAGICTIYGLLFAGLLIASLPSIEAQSSGTPTRTTSTNQLQDGD